MDYSNVDINWAKNYHEAANMFLTPGQKIESKWEQSGYTSNAFNITENDKDQEEISDEIIKQYLKPDL